MPNQASFTAKTPGAVVQGTVTDKLPVLPGTPPTGRTAIGPRITPNFINEAWSSDNTYQYYDVVLVEGTSYIARKAVPEGIEITNTEYWIRWSEPNAQMAELNNTVEAVSKEVTQNSNSIEKINDNIVEINQNISDIDGKIDENTNSIQNIITKNKCWLCATKNATTNLVDFLFTDDLENFTRIGTYNFFSSLNYFDLIYLKKLNDFYYIFTNYNYAVTKDFKSFKTYTYNNYDPNNVNATASWGMSFVPNTNYIIGAIQNDDTSATNLINATIAHVNPVYATYTQNEVTGELTISNFNKLNLPDFVIGTSSYIDPDCCQFNGQYYIIYKNEYTTGFELYSASTFESFINGSSTHVKNYIPFRGGEAPKFVNTDNELSIIVSEYAWHSGFNAFFTPKPTSYYGDSKNKPIFYKDILNKNCKTVFCKMDTENRHLGIIEIDETIYKNLQFFKIMQTETCNKNAYYTLNENTQSYIYNGPICCNTCIDVVSNCKITLNINNITPSNNDNNNMKIAVNTQSNSANYILGTGFAASLTNKNIVGLNASSVEHYRLYDSQTAMAVPIGGVLSLIGLNY